MAAVHCERNVEVVRVDGVDAEVRLVGLCAVIAGNNGLDVSGAVVAVCDVNITV